MVRSRIRRIACLAVVLVMVLLVITAPLAAMAAEHLHSHEGLTTVRVGFFEFDGYHNIAEDGARSGYGYDLLQLMARYEQLDYVYVGYDKSIGQSEEMLANGEIDLLTAIKWSEERAEKFDFSSRNIGTASTQISIKAGNTDIVSGDYSTYDGCTFGVLQDTTRAQELVDFSREHGFKPQTIYFATTKELAQALQDGAVDAIVSTSLRAKKNEWVIESFNEEPIYAVVRKGDQKTLQMVNHALDRMELEEHHWHTVLPEKYHSGTHNSMLFFTQAEREFLQKLDEQNTVFRVLVNPDRYPYSYVKDGQLAGIMIDLFDVMARRAGIRYEWILCADREDYANRMINEETDICIDMTPDFYFAEDLGYIITDVYLTAPFSWVRRNESTQDIKHAAKLIYTRFTPAQYVYNNLHHDIEYTEYATQEECIRSVKDGVTDGYCAYTYQAEQIILHDTSNTLMATIALTENQFAIGTTHYIDRRLDSILNKAVGSLDEWDIVEATRRHTSIASMNPSFLELLKDNFAVRVATFSLVLIILLLLALATQQKRLQKRMKNTIDVQRWHLNKSMESMLGLLASAIEFRSSESGDHVKRISSITHDVLTSLVKMYPEDYRFSEEQIHQMSTASVLHDVGKIAIPDFVLNKPGKLSPVEYKLMQQHPVKGCQLLKRIPNLSGDALYSYAYDICRWHHERWDGKGYPDGLKGDDIPIWAQAASVADVFDALISPRVYKKAYSIPDAIQMICNGQCGQFNPRIIEAFLAVADCYEAPAEEQPEEAFAAPASNDITALMFSAFQTLLANSTDTVFLKDTNLVYRAASARFAEQIGKTSAEEVIYRTDSELFSDPMEVLRNEEEDRDLLSSGDSVVESLVSLGVQDGMQHYGSTTKYLLTDDAGRPMGILGITRDITSSYLSHRHHHSTIESLFVLQENAYYSGYLDVTSWLIVEEKLQRVRGYEMDTHSSMEEIAENALASIRDKHIPAYLFFKEFHPEALNAMYESGKHKVILEFPCSFPGYEERWVRNEINFLVDPANGHLCMAFTVLDIDQQKKSELELIERAENDPLTGVLNRSASRTLAEQTIKNEQFEGSMHALFILDLDGFKKINDTFGHRAGDECLQILAQTLKTTFRSSDLVSRLGGDEFLVFMRFVTTREVVEARAGRLIENLNRAAVPYPGIVLNASVGIALFPTDGADLDQLYERADKALYHAKAMGKNHFCFASDL